MITELIKFETEFTEQKQRKLWKRFLLRKYGNEQRIPKEPKDEDWEEFTKELGETVKEGVVQRMYPNLSAEQKKEMKKQIVLKIEKDYLVGG